MGRLLKLLGIILGAIVVLIVAAVVAVTVLVDPNDYKDQITAAVNRATGRELTLEGDLGLEFFPSIRVSVGAARLSNAPGFGDQPFAEIDGASLEVALFPLLSRRLEVGEAELRGLVLNLARDADGRNNWQDLAGGSGTSAEPETATDESGGGAAVDLNVDELRVVDSEVTWNDAATDNSWRLHDFNFVASGFGPGVAFPLSTGFTLDGEAVTVTIDAQTRATLSLEQNLYTLEGLAVAIQGAGPNWPGGEPSEARLDFDSFVANLANETLDLDGLTLQILGVTVNGALEGTQILGNFTLGGAVQIQPFDPGALLERYGAAVETADPAVLSNASAEATFVLDPGQTALRDMRLTLDDSTLTGSVGVVGSALRFDLAVDTINIDRYLPPAAEEEAAPESEGSVDEVDLPLDALRTLDAEGRLALSQAQFTGLTLTDAAFDLRAGDGRLTLTPVASLYGGTIEGEISLAVEQGTARAALMSVLTGVDMLPLGRDLLGSEMVSGRGDLRLDLTTTGSNVGQMRRDLDGDVSFAITDGAWEGFDAWFELVRARTVFEGQGRPERPEGPRRTPFSSVSASGVVEDAILTNRDLNATLEFMTITGEGTVNLLTDELDFDVVASFTDGPTLQSSPLMARLAGQSLPLEVGGTLAEPSIRPDFAGLVRARAQEAIDEAVQEERGRVEERVEQERTEVQERVEQERSEVQERVDTEREQLREDVRDRLRGLFD